MALVWAPTGVPVRPLCFPWLHLAHAFVWSQTTPHLPLGPTQPQGWHCHPSAQKNLTERLHFSALAGPPSPACGAGEAVKS